MVPSRLRHKGKGVAKQAIVFSSLYLPPPAMVALISESNSSSPLMASCKWRGVIRFTFRSLDAFPANSSTWGTMTKANYVRSRVVPTHQETMAEHPN